MHQHGSINIEYTFPLLFHCFGRAECFQLTFLLQNYNGTLKLGFKASSTVS